VSKTINATDAQIDAQIRNIANMIHKIDNDWQVTITKNFGPGGGPGIGQYYTLLPGTASGTFDPAVMKNAFNELAGKFTSKIAEIRSNLVKQQDNLIGAAHDFNSATKAAEWTATGMP
jgi:hypothetical protein